METALRPRADRVTLDIPIMYHRPGDDHWFQASVVNLSASGVLFGPSELEPGALRLTTIAWNQWSSPGR